MFAKRVDMALERALAETDDPSAPPRLIEAMRYAVIPGGGRIRPRLCMAVAEACGGDAPHLAEAAAAAIELMHSASLVHDDLPCFDNADLRRGKPTVHCVYGEELALLVGDGLIVLAFDVLARAATQHPRRLAPMVRLMARGVGAPRGIIAGQAWESEPELSLEHYHRAKTAALFEAAVGLGALSSGSEPEPWMELGGRLGEAYQIADDILDTLGSPEEMGKPVGQDSIQGRPNAVNALGVQESFSRLEHLVGSIAEVIPPASQSDLLVHWLSKLVEKHFRPRIHQHLQAQRAQGVV